MSHEELQPGQDAQAATPPMTFSPEPAVEVEDAPAKVETCKEYLKYTFTPDEREALASEMSRNIVDLSSAREELDTIKAQYKSRITALEGEVSGSARKLHAGYEMRNIECRVERDYDAKLIRIYRLDSGDLVREKAMTTEELQRRLPV